MENQPTESEHTCVGGVCAEWYEESDEKKGPE